LKVAKPRLFKTNEKDRDSRETKNRQSEKRQRGRERGLKEKKEINTFR
jgi:hypothetical protein